VTGGYLICELPFSNVKRLILVYGLVGGALIVALKLIEYRFLVVSHSVELYGGLIALVFAVVGIWLGLKLTKTKETVVVREAPYSDFGFHLQQKTRPCGCQK
jgi:hypothetical protein